MAAASPCASRRKTASHGSTSSTADRESARAPGTCLRAILSGRRIEHARAAGHRHRPRARQELVELHGGTIAVESASGATFIVTLPLGRSHLRDDQIVAGSEGSLARTDELEVDHVIAGNGETETRDGDGAADVTTLLIVDDSADMRAYVRSHFQSRYRVEEAADGGDGIERARSLLPDLVISDVMMPGIDGNALCRTLKSDPETDFIPIDPADRVGLDRRPGRRTRGWCGRLPGQAIRDARARRARGKPHRHSATSPRAVCGRGCGASGARATVRVGIRGPGVRR